MFQILLFTSFPQNWRSSNHLAHLLPWSLLWVLFIIEDPRLILQKESGWGREDIQMSLVDCVQFMLQKGHMPNTCSALQEHFFFCKNILHGKEFCGSLVGNLVENLLCVSDAVLVC